MILLGFEDTYIYTYTNTNSYTGKLTSAVNNMVCPMRFVLVGFSVVIATFGIFMYNEHSQSVSSDNDNNEKQDRKQHSSSMLQNIWNVFNGQVLYKENKRACEHGGITYLIFLGVMVILTLLTMLYVILPYFVDKSILSGFCPHHYIPYAHEIKNGYKVFLKILTG